MQESRNSPISIGVAEDDPDARVALQRLLERLGYHVCCAVEDGGELLHLRSVYRFDLVIVDLDMPIVDGLTTAEEIAESGVPVVLVSGHPDVHDIVVDREPVITVLRKPVIVDELQNAVELALGGPRQLNGGDV